MMQEKVWRNQILMTTGDRPLVLLTTYGYNDPVYKETLDYLFPTFRYMVDNKNPNMDGIRGHGEWVYW